MAFEDLTNSVKLTVRGFTLFIVGILLIAIIAFMMRIISVRARTTLFTRINNQAIILQESNNALVQKQLELMQIEQQKRESDDIERNVGILHTKITKLSDELNQCRRLTNPSH